MTIPYYRASKNGIAIRPYHNEDVKADHEAILESVDYMSEHLDWCHKNYSLEETKNWVESRYAAWQKGNTYSFVIYNLETGRILGEVDIVIYDRPHNCAYIGYWVRKSALKKGVATTASQLAARFAFKELKINRIELIVSTVNFGSQRVAEKLGAKKEGLLSKRIFLHGNYIDAFLYALFSENLTQ
jgi:ribosomal-protein-serine acetyltransferase